MPMTVPEPNATCSASPSELRAACVQRTAARVDVCMPNQPAAADAVAPLTNAIAARGPRSAAAPPNAITAPTKRMKTATHLYSARRKALAPSWTWRAISCIRASPGSRRRMLAYVNSAKPSASRAATAETKRKFRAIDELGRRPSRRRRGRRRLGLAARARAPQEVQHDGDQQEAEDQVQIAQLVLELVHRAPEHLSEVDRRRHGDQHAERVEDQEARVAHPQRPGHEVARDAHAGEEAADEGRPVAVVLEAVLELREPLGVQDAASEAVLERAHAPAPAEPEGDRVAGEDGRGAGQGDPEEVDFAAVEEQPAADQRDFLRERESDAAEQEHRERRDVVEAHEEPGDPIAEALVRHASGENTGECRARAIFPRFEPSPNRRTSSPQPLTIF